jgi:hypothetical protein
MIHDAWHRNWPSVRRSAGVSYCIAYSDIISGLRFPLIRLRGDQLELLTPPRIAGYFAPQNKSNPVRAAVLNEVVMRLMSKYPRYKDWRVRREKADGQPHGQTMQLQ